MIRIHFTPDDLRRISFRTEPEPLRDAALGARALGADMVPPVAARWGRQARTRLRREMRPLFELVGPRGTPDFLSPDLDEPDLATGVSVLMDTPLSVIRAELEPVASGTGWVGDLLAGRASARRQLGAAVRAFHAAALQPWAPVTGMRFSADLAVRSRALLRGGVDELLSTLHPDVVWSAPTLTTYAAKPPGSHLDVWLNGRGLELYPSALDLALPGPGPAGPAAAAVLPGPGRAVRRLLVRRRR